jgi:chromosome segregation ATPase
MIACMMMFIFYVTYEILFTVENVVKIEDILNLINRDSGNASTSGISKAHCMDLQAQVECLAKTASIHEQKMADHSHRLNAYVERLESELLGGQVSIGSEQWATNTAMRQSDLELKMATKQIEDLTQRLSDYDSRGVELSETKRKANALLLEKDSQLTAARKRIEVLEKEVSELLASGKALRERISSLEHNKVLLARETQAAQSAKIQEEKSRASLEQSFWRVGSLEKENATLSRELTAVKKEKEKLEETFAAIKSARASSSQELESKRSELSASMKRHKELQAALDKATKQSQDAAVQSKEKFAELEKSRDATASELSEVRRKANILLNQKADELLGLKRTLEQAEKETARFKLECKNLEARVLSLEKENSALNDDVKKLQSEHSSYLEEKKDMQSRIDGLLSDTAKSDMQRGDQISSLETALEIQQSARDLLTAEMKELQAALDRSMKQVQESNSIIREKEITARREKDQAALELSEIKRKANALLAQQAEELTRVRKRAEDVEKELILVKAKCADAETRCNSYQKENGILARESGTLKQEKSSFAKEKAQLVTRVAGLEIAVTKSSEKIKLMEKTIDALKASQASTARELQESRAHNEKTLASAYVRQNELQTSLENSLKQVREAAAKEKERATSLDNENRICASELTETKRKANALLSKQCEELTALRNGMQQKQVDLASSKSECATLQGRVAGLVAEKEQLLKDVAKIKRDGEACEKLRKEAEAEQARLQKQCDDLKRSNASLTEQMQSMRRDSSADIVFVEKRRTEPSNFKNAQNVAENRSADAKLLLIRIEALQNQNKSLESDKAKLIEDLSQLRGTMGPGQKGTGAGRRESPGSDEEAGALDAVEEVCCGVGPWSSFSILTAVRCVANARSCQLRNSKSLTSCKVSCLKPKWLATMHSR